MTINTDRNYGQILTASVARRSKQVQDIVYDSTPLTAILRDRDNVKVKRAADVDITRDLVSVGFWVEPGPVVHLGQIDIKGLGSIPEDQIPSTTVNYTIVGGKVAYQKQ